ncbi:hypothetical protein [Piscinibacter gummiphilus]|uniref:Transporter n=1 Tax=Piscinibacter gummiphilus TaxID=946333 RepID=A0ABZ0CUK4_9BURK|nr:hypothetical protein [Piscinibacter gummiphilus]WOB06568.1 hypothetical protein RXV79_16745 [Piscinibacter gummiphilus]
MNALHFARRLTAYALTSAWLGAHAQAGSAAASAPAADKKPFSLSIRPVVLDSADAAGTALGVDYDLQYSRAIFGRGGKESTGVGEDTVDPDKLPVLSSTFVNARLRGTLASSKEKNPNKLVDLSTDALREWDTNAGFFSLGGVFKFETDQGLDNKQHMFGISGQYSIPMGTLWPGDVGSLMLNYGSVKPTSNDARKAQVGNLDSFRRIEMELTYTLPVNRGKLWKLDFGYRHFQELNPPEAIKASGMDRNRLGIVRARLTPSDPSQKDWYFIQYSRGSLPFDKATERAVKIGWNLQLE